MTPVGGGSTHIVSFRTRGRDSGRDNRAGLRRPRAVPTAVATAGGLECRRRGRGYVGLVVVALLGAGIPLSVLPTEAANRPQRHSSTAAPVRPPLPAPGAAAARLDAAPPLSADATPRVAADGRQALRPGEGGDLRRTGAVPARPKAPAAAAAGKSRHPVGRANAPKDKPPHKKSSPPMKSRGEQAAGRQVAGGSRSHR